MKTKTRKPQSQIIYVKRVRTTVGLGRVVGRLNGQALVRLDDRPEIPGGIPLVFAVNPDDLEKAEE